MNITKAQLSNKISSENNISLEISSEFVKSFFQIQKKILESRNLKISKFGTFYRTQTPERLGRNPKTLIEYLIPKRTKLVLEPQIE